MNSCPLKPSPIAALRRRYGLSRRQAALRLGMNPRHFAALEMRSAGVPRCTLDAMEALFGTLRRYTQLTIWDALEALEREGGVERA